MRKVVIGITGGLVLNALIIGIAVHYLFLRYPLCIKSVAGPSRLVAHLYVEPRDNTGWVDRLVNGLTLGDPLHNNVHTFLVVERNGKVLRKETLELSDLVIDVDDTTLTWQNRTLTVVVEGSTEAKKYAF